MYCLCVFSLVCVFFCYTNLSNTTCGQVPALAEFHRLLLEREGAQQTIRRLFLGGPPSQRYKGKATLVAAPPGARGCISSTAPGEQVRWNPVCNSSCSACMCIFIAVCVLDLCGVCDAACLWYYFCVMCFRRHPSYRRRLPWWSTSGQTAVRIWSPVSLVTTSVDCAPGPTASAKSKRRDCCCCLHVCLLVLACAFGFVYSLLYLFCFLLLHQATVALESFGLQAAPVFHQQPPTPPPAVYSSSKEARLVLLSAFVHVCIVFCFCTWSIYAFSSMTTVLYQATAFGVEAASEFRHQPPTPPPPVRPAQEIARRVPPTPPPRPRRPVVLMARVALHESSPAPSTPEVAKTPPRSPSPTPSDTSHSPTESCEPDEASSSATGSEGEANFERAASVDSDEL